MRRAAGIASRSRRGYLGVIGVVLFGGEGLVFRSSGGAARVERGGGWWVKSNDYNRARADELKYCRRFRPGDIVRDDESRRRRGRMRGRETRGNIFFSSFVGRRWTEDLAEILFVGSVGVWFREPFGGAGVGPNSLWLLCKNWLALAWWRIALLLHLSKTIHKMT